jgi:pimeloyl-ACP methyl ester carboxylesterase
MNRRTFANLVAAGAASTLVQGADAAVQPAPMARNIVLVHGLFADASSWSEVIARLQAMGLNVTAVQNPLTTLPEAVAAAERVLARQDGPTVLVGHSFSGMIVTEAGVHSNVSALVYVAARAPDAGEDYAALAKTFPTPPASAGIVFDGDEGRLSEAAFLQDFAGDVPQAKAKILYAVQEPFHKALLAGKTTRAAWRSKPSFYAVSTEDRTINPDLERFMAQRMGGQNSRSKGEPPFPDIAARHDRKSDPRGGRANLTSRFSVETHGSHPSVGHVSVGSKSAYCPANALPLWIEQDGLDTLAAPVAVYMIPFSPFQMKVRPPSRPSTA